MMATGTAVPRAAGACGRAGLVAGLVAAPHLMCGGPAEATPLVVLFALLAAAFVAGEYAALAPSILEFRDAPPFNRLRLAGLALAILALALALGAREGGATLPLLLRALGERLGEGMDGPLSPVRLLLAALPPGTDPARAADVALAASAAYAASLGTAAVFVLALRLRAWPRSRDFNLWVNLPRFDPSGGRDVAGRLEREAHVNLLLGTTLPFLAPMAAALLRADPLAPLGGQAALIWTVTAWAFLPASLLMRGVALLRVAGMIRAQRRAEAHGPAWQPA